MVAGLVLVLSRCAYGSIDIQWLSSGEIEREYVTDALNAIGSLTPQAAAEEATLLRGHLESRSGEAKQAAGLLLAAALEQSGRLDEARDAYRRTTEEEKGSAYGTSALLRFRFLLQPTHNAEDDETFYQSIAREPEGDEGWFLVGEKWVCTTSRQAANQYLIDCRQTHLSFRVFQLFRSRSPWPDCYAYLFALLVVTIGLKILTAPLHFKRGKFLAVVLRVRPEIKLLQRAHGDDFVTFSKRLGELHESHGVSAMSDLLVQIVDVVFIVWALFALNFYSPQIAFDHGKFLWIEDVTQPNLWITCAWAVLFFFFLLIAQKSQPSPQSPIVALASNAYLCVLLSVIAWFKDWPAYVFVFAILLSLLGGLLTWGSTAIYLVIRK